MVIVMAEEVHNHQLNDSPTKQQFSFPKARRFRQRTTEYCPPRPAHSQYSLPSTFSKKAFTFGSAPRKSCLVDNSKGYLEVAPPPGAYTPSEHAEKSPSWSFGGCKKPAIPGTQLSVRYMMDIPGPGSYNVLPVDFGKDGHKFSMRMKATPGVNRSQTPGPGSYRPKVDINSMGVYFSSNIPNSCAPRISPSYDIVRKIPVQTRAPGPGAYNPKDGLSGDGSYFLSRIPSSQCRTFGRGSRSVSAKRIQTPGPGSYRLPSDFGFYDSSTPTGQQLSKRSATPNGRRLASARALRQD